MACGVKYKFALLLNIIIYLGSFSICAQNNYEEWKENAFNEYDQFNNNAVKEYNDFRDKANTEYAEFMKHPWPKFSMSKLLSFPARHEPIIQPIADPNIDTSSDDLHIEKIKPIAALTERPIPIIDIPKINSLNINYRNKLFDFILWGTVCSVHLDQRHKFKLKNCEEQTISIQWNALSKPLYNDVINDCLYYRSSMNLCDWAYIKFIETLCNSFFCTKNESILLQMYLLTQSGYQVRIGRAENNLCLFLPCDSIIYNYNYVVINNQKYYVLDTSLNKSSFSIYSRMYPREKIMSLCINKLPTLQTSYSKSKIIEYKKRKIQTSVNCNLIEFYNSYPVTNNWDLYSKASLSEHAKSLLYPKLKDIVSNLSEIDALNCLLDFVQTSFKYATDKDQFGYERPLFGDESLYYPYCDCEDRSILFSILVREILKLKVVLLDYPNHISTAVCLNIDCKGDYVDVDNEKYLICDPTYIGACVGQSMPCYKDKGVNIIKID